MLTATKACAVLAIASLVATLFISCVGQSSGIGSPQSNSNPPNLIYILADDLGYGDLGRNGQRLINTPVTSHSHDPSELFPFPGEKP